MVPAAAPTRPPDLPRHRRRTLAALLTALLAVAVVVPLTSAPAAAAPPAVGEGRFDVLVFSKTAGFRHSSIPFGIAAIEDLGEQHDFSVTATEDATVFTAAGLAPYEAVVFLSTTGDVLNADQEAALEAYVRGGGGFTGVHAAADTEYGWEFYGDLVGAYFQSHPQNQTATVVVEDAAHPSTADLPQRWERFDEWYNYQSNPRGDVHVLASLDERTYSPGAGAMGADHPISWCRHVDAGRSWYTGMGHTNESFAEPAFLDHLLGGIETAAGAVPADCAATVPGSFDKVALDENTANPMELDVADDGRVFYLERNGPIRVVETSGAVRTLLTLAPYTGQESGMLGIALDPDFATNRHVFVMWSPNPASANVDRLSRFTVSADGTSIDPASEVVVLDVPVQRQTCCHNGGALEFDSQGNLFITTGDNTNPFESQGYTPIDERSGREAFDAQRTSANTNSLSGKLLRITPQPDGTYTVPAGNLFPPGTAQTRPEIYGMGFRNPFRIGIDPATDHLMLADYGPDAGGGNAARGPDGRVEWSVISQPGNYGWPYCHADNTAYVNWDFATNSGSGSFDCANPVNTSPNNTGLTQLPPAIGAQIWYGKQPQTAWPAFGTGGAPMAGPVYRYDPDLQSDRKWPAAWDGHALLGEWGQGRFYDVLLDEAGTAPVKATPFLPQGFLNKPMAWDYGPDGALYVIDWGSGFGGNNADSGVYRIDYVAGSRSPVARAAADVTSGPVPLTVTFSSAGSQDPDGGPVTLAWDLDGDGDVDSGAASPTFTYTAAGSYQALLRVTDDEGLEATATVNIAAGNTRPTVTVTGPPAGGFTEFGDTIPYEVAVSDPEDEAGAGIDCQQVVLKPALGHDDHGHPGDQYRGCSGEFVATIDDSHGPEADIFVIVEADYTDRGGAGGAPPLIGTDLITLQPKLKQAEYFTETGRIPGGTGGGNPGVQREATGDTAGGFQNLGFIEDGDWWSYDPVNLTGIDSVTARVASNSGGGLLEVRWDAPDGPVLATLDVPGTGNWQGYTEVSADLPTDLPTESGTLYFVAQHRTGGAGGLFNVNWLRFGGQGVSSNSAPVVSVTATPDSGTAPLPVRLAATATDPDGDAVTGRWTTGIPGDAPRDGDTVDVVYSEPGDYTATYTATDARGASRTATVDVSVAAPPSTPCLAGRSDDFTGDSLDTDRWEVVRPDGNLRVEGGELVLPTTTTDIYGTNNTGTPNLVLQALPDGPFVATARLTLPARTQYQQAGLLLYGDDDNYAKFVLQGRAATGSPSAANRIFQFIREVNGTPNEVAASNTAQLGADYPDTVHVRFTSTTGDDLRASYSADGTVWTDMPETKSIADIVNPRIGLVSLAGSGARPVTEARFDWFSITPDDTAGAPEPADEFDGTALDTCRWQVVRPEPDALSVGDGRLTVLTGDGDIYGGNNTGPTNFVLQPAPVGDWSFETSLDTSQLTQQYQQAGLIAYVDDANYVKFDQLATNPAGSPVQSNVELRGEIADSVQATQPTTGQVPLGEIRLRLTRTGTTIAGAYSVDDGATWVTTGSGGAPLSVVNAAVAESPALRVGLFSLGANQTERAPVSFDWFRPAADEPPPDTTAPEVTAALDPAAPASGWFAGPVTVTLTATDDSQAAGGVVYTEYRIGDGDWAEYTAPVVLDPATLGEGPRRLEYRASDTAGNVSAVGAVEASFDTVAPLTTATPEPDGTVVRVALAATDETSGVAGTEYSLDGGPWTAYTAPVELAVGDPHEVRYRSTDVAGNVEADKALTLAGDTTAPVLTVAGVADGEVYGDSTDLVLSWAATDDSGRDPTVVARLDGVRIRPGTLVLHELDLGVHRLVVVATDDRGNRTRHVVDFATATSYPDVSRLIDRFVASNRLDPALARDLEKALDRSLKALGGSGKRAEDRAVTRLEEFRSIAAGATDPMVRQVLDRDAAALITSIRGGSPATAVP
jgi:glucose/arabinose dehydrogenase/PKD repeat protein